MTTHDDKKRDLPQATSASTDNTAKDAGGKPDETRDPNLYDPVGMAGRKAGLVKEIEQELKEEEMEPRPDRDRESTTEKA